MSRPPHGFIDRLLRREDGIPAGLSLDPQQFPESEYPVFCLECGYALDTLPDGRCPECGREFSRGELLVDIYARLLRPHRDPSRRFAWAVGVLGLTPALLAPVALVGVFVINGWDYERTHAALDPILDPRRAGKFGAIPLISLILLPVSVLLGMRDWPPREKRRAIEEAISARIAGQAEPPPD